ncbi:MAG: patatin-like phospholipase family protein [Methylovirgula sp.]
MSDPIRILSIDGGGIRGIIPAMVLQAILGERKAKDVFHLIAGTSTGGIIACGLAKPDPIPLNDILDLYVEHGGEIFRRAFLHKAPGADFVSPKYAPTELQKYLKAQFGKTMLSEVRDVELLVPSYAIHLPRVLANGDTRAPMFFRSWQAGGRLLDPPAQAADYDFPLKSIAQATSAAPTYFPPATIHNKAGHSFSMIDGGVFANNPTISAMVEAYHLYHATDFIVVSLGTGYLQAPIDPRAAEKWGELKWMLPILSVLMDGNSDTVCFETSELLGDAFYRLDIALGAKTLEGESVDENFDDATPENIKALQDKARQLIDSEKDKIQSLKELLRDDKTAVQPMNALPPQGLLAAKARHAIERAHLPPA